MNGHNIVSSICVRAGKKYLPTASRPPGSDKSKSLKKINILDTFI